MRQCLFPELDAMIAPGELHIYPIFRTLMTGGSAVSWRSYSEKQYIY
jgi:hypothetical protein